MNILLPAFYFLIFIFLICNLKFFHINEIPRKTIVLLFIIKVACGALLTLIYKYYYNSDSYSDAYAFYYDGIKIFNSIYTNPLDYLRLVTGIGSDAKHLEQFYSTCEYWDKAFNYNLYNDNRILIRFNAVISLFSFGYYHVHTLFMTFLSFIGLTAIYKTFIPFLKNKKTELLICVFLIPSVLLWTSGVLKESLVLFAFGIFIYAFFKLLSEKIRLMNLILIYFGIFFLLFSKFYYLLAALPGLFTIFFLIKRNVKKVIPVFIIVHVCFFILLYLSKYLIPEFNFLEIITQKQNDFINMVQATGNTGSFINIPIMHPTIFSLIKNSIPAFLNTLCRPFFPDIRSIIMIPSVIENIVIMLAIIFAFIYSEWKTIVNKGVLFSLLSFVTILFVLFGLITPVLGSLVRYRTPVLPFLFIALLMIYNKEKFIGSAFYKYFLRRKIF